MAATEKRCYYEVLGLQQSCTQDEIRSAYKKLALQRHPDKLIQSGIASADATAAFQELVRAYEILSDPKERSWYDSHRSQILFSSNSGSDSNSNSDSPFPDLFSYFSPSCYTDYTNPKTGFYKVYGDVFDKIYAHEIKYCRLMGLNLGLVKEAPLLGDLKCDYSQVNAFYGYWLGFSTVMDFGWVDKYDAAAGENRKSRRVMEEENKKVRKKAKREFNETVRGLAEFVKKRDKRVIDMMVKKEKEREKKRAEEMAKKKEKEREKLERARMYQEPDWAKVEEVELEDLEEDGEGEEERKELYCAACGKKFKSDKQWKNHEQSKKHKEKVAHLRKSFIEEDDFEDVEQVDVDGGIQHEDETEPVAKIVDDKNDVAGNVDSENVVIDDGFVSAEDDVDELEERFQESVGFEEGKSRYELPSDKEDGIGNDELNDIGQSPGGSDDESIDLEAMISGRWNKKHVTSKNESFERNNVQSEDDIEPMEYNNKKVKKKSRRAKKEKDKPFQAEPSRVGDNVTNVPVMENNGLSASDTANNADDDQVDHDPQTSTKAGKKSFGRKEKGTIKRDTETKPKNSCKGRKQKEKSKNLEPVCEKCGEEFESRSKLHKHLSETGHATVKIR
ncbi:DNAJ protein JJJ1 homolog [Chenopodium quinoa]|uniref:DNAJ protein JJJ1 homolog n=1 Tax=Chenopodium quinoa TaxID=63459 RepID=UPI000B77CD69|nr:DNAJ protein JJJ1 homolog [Chenopodium quinoa]